MSRPHRILLIAAGTALVALAVVGMFIPVLPTTPFLLLAAALYARSSERFYRWLLGQRHLGRYLHDYRAHRGMRPVAKAITLALLWVGIGASALLATESLPLRIVLLVIAAGVTAHIIAIRTLRG